jgi:hypothetical protein
MVSLFSTFHEAVKYHRQMPLHTLNPLVKKAFVNLVVYITGL